MLLTEDTSDDGELRIYFTRSSVVSYFTDDDDGGVKAHASPSDFACPWSTTPDKLHAVKMEMLGACLSSGLDFGWRVGFCPGP